MNTRTITWPAIFMGLLILLAACNGVRGQTIESETSSPELMAAVNTDEHSNQGTTAISNEIPVLSFGTTDQIQDASARLTMIDGAYELSINTTGLTPGHVVTVWWGAHGASASFQLADGQVINENGHASFKANMSLDSVREGARIHFVIRDHGPVVPEMIDDQLSKPGGGCANFSPRTGPNECTDIQEGAFDQS